MNSPKHTVSTGSIIIAAKDQVSTDLDGETVILNLESGTYYSLDPVGTRIWSLIQESKTVGEIRDIILEEYEVEPDRCEQDIIALIEQLVDTGLVQILLLKAVFIVVAIRLGLWILPFRVLRRLLARVMHKPAGLHQVNCPSVDPSLGHSVDNSRTSAGSHGLLESIVSG
jgi:hypothetical protein